MSCFFCHYSKIILQKPKLFAVSVVRTLTGHKSSIRGIDFHPYGEFVASGSLDTNVKVSKSTGPNSYKSLNFTLYQILRQIMTDSLVM